MIRAGPDQVFDALFDEPPDAESGGVVASFDGGAGAAGAAGVVDAESVGNAVGPAGYFGSLAIAAFGGSIFKLGRSISECRSRVSRCA